MKLMFKSPHLSIDSLADTELPQFVVLTGVNGSGKSHLLQAIHAGKISIKDMVSPNVVLFNYETFRLENENNIRSDSLTQQIEEAWKYFDSTVHGPSRSWKMKLPNEYDELKKDFVVSGISLWSNTVINIEQYKNDVTLFFQRKGVKNNATAQVVLSIIKRSPVAAHDINRIIFDSLYIPITLKEDFLPTQLGKVFFEYYKKFEQNDYYNYKNSIKEGDRKSISREEFKKIYGPCPWTLVDNILSEFDNMLYKVKSPDGLDYFANYLLKLVHTAKPNVEVLFSDLSSGERVLMALVACVYKASSDAHFPDLLLLDEVDASLHPSMIKNMLRVIMNEFVERGVAVILVTHSPTTVALAPEESVYLMNREGPNRIVKKSKTDAVSILSQGFATIEQGLKIFDDVSKNEVTIISEGRNRIFLEKALEFYEISGVYIISGFENGSGDKQLATIFRFFSVIEHKKKVIVIWDCDADKTCLEFVEKNNTFPLFIRKNTENKIAQSGIENAFPEGMFDNFITSTIKSNGDVVRSFDKSRKRDFERHVLLNGKKEDFSRFAELMENVRKIISQ